MQCGELSLICPVGFQSGDCGYCRTPEDSSRTPDSRASYYALSSKLCPQHYQVLMDRGWRRSGTLFYLPDASRSCCTHYTIRLPAAELDPIRDQRQALNRWNRHVLGEEYMKEVNRKYPRTKEEKKRQKNTFDLIATVHESEYSNLKPDIKPEHKFEVTLETDIFTEEKYKLFEDYQRNVHHEGDHEISRNGFRRFLCNSPLHRHTIEGKQLGSFHQCYRLDGRLIAMSVLDLLPHGVSGVYFIYHSDFSKWSFGKISALREAALTIEGGYEWLYMGYYIHSCKKMRYKGDYKMQRVLDYDTLEWDVLDDEMRELMDKRQWVCMSRERKIKTALEKAKGQEVPNGGDSESTQNLHYDQPRSQFQSDLEAAEVAKAYAVQYPNPISAVQSRLPAFRLNVPGVTDLYDLLRDVDIDTIKVRIGRRRNHTGPQSTSTNPGGTSDMSDVYEMRDLEAWAGGDMMNTETLKGCVVEMACCVGANVAREVVVNLAMPM